jgi:hypothetical protein
LTVVFSFAIMQGFVLKNAKNYMPSGKFFGMVRKMDDGPKTDRLPSSALEKTLGLLVTAGASWEY